MYSISTDFGVCTTWNGRSSNSRLRGNPPGSPIVESGSLFCSIGTCLMPSPDLCVLPSASPHGVSGAVWYPRAPMPAPPASQMPVRSRFGAGPGAAAAG